MQGGGIVQPSRRRRPGGRRVRQHGGRGRRKGGRRRRREGDEEEGWEDISDDEESDDDKEADEEEEDEDIVPTDSFPDRAEVLKEIQKNIDDTWLSDYHAAQVCLLKLLTKHRGNDFKLFDAIMRWVLHFSAKCPGIFSPESTIGLSSKRAPLMTLISKVFGAEGLEAQSKEVELEDGSKVTIPVFDFNTQLLEILTDPGQPRATMECPAAQ